MHIIDSLSPDFYEVEQRGNPVTLWDVFPDWSPHDRFGIVIYEPLAAIGAAHLIQVACMCFYDVKPTRRTDRRIYPEIFAIHVGGWHGGNGNLDFWPGRREVLVSDDHREILDAINNLGLTRLAIPERVPRDIVHRRKEEDCALDRLVTAIMYSPTGQVCEPDFVIKSNSRRSERDIQKTINPTLLSEESIAQLEKANSLVKETDFEFAPKQEELNCNITEAIREQAKQHRKQLIVEGKMTETYKSVSPAISLKCL